MEVGAAPYEKIETFLSKEDSNYKDGKTKTKTKQSKAKQKEEEAYKTYQDKQPNKENYFSTIIFSEILDSRVT